MLLFWTEFAIVGVFNILKIVICSPTSPAKWVEKLFVVPFFSIHYGIFTLVYGIFVYILFGGLIFKEAEIPDLNPIMLRQIIGSYHLVWGFLSLFLSHGISFVINYVRTGEYKEADLYDLCWQPYKRVLFLHLTIIFGGFILIYLGSPIGGLILLIVLKMAIDALAHLKLHKEKSPTKVSKSGFTTR